MSLDLAVPTASGIDRELRLQGVGASEAAALWGLHPYLTRYTLQKRKKHPAAFETPETDWQAFGHILEEPLMRVYSYITKRKTRFMNITQKHPDWPIVYSPDGMCEDEPIGVEIKAYTDEGRRYFGPDQDQLPDFMAVQAHVYLACMQFLQRYDVFVWLAGRPHIFSVYPDRELEAAIIKEAVTFWIRHVEGDEELPIDDPDAADRYLQWRYPTHRRPDLRIATTEEITMLNEYAQVRQNFDHIVARRKVLESEIKAAIQDKEGLTWPDGRFTWRRSKDSQVVRWEDMALGLLNAHVEDPAKREEILDFYTRPKPGPRRIHFTHKDLKQEEEQNG